jgi:hypothetical protein
MRPPYTADQFFGVFTRYNEALWPAPLVLLALGCTLVLVAYLDPSRARVVFAGLALLWAWSAGAFHVAFFASVTSAAYLYGVLFLAEAALLAWHGLHTRRLHLATPLDRPARIVGGALAVYALIGSPLVAALLGQHYPAQPTFGLPCPTTILTFALLAWCMRPVPWSLLVIPIGWTVVATSAAVSFGVAEDFVLPLAAVLAIALLFRPRAPHPRALSRVGRPIEMGF